jgi:flagellar secretion chaperone FliS
MYNGIENYFESGVLSADPVELVRMLYRGGIEAVEKARQHLREGDIAARSAQITKAGAIIAHLTFSVNREADQAMGRNLVELYDYMQRRLLRGNLEQADHPLAEVSLLLSTLLDAWSQCGAAAPAPAEGVPAGVFAEAEPELEYAGQSWSF